MSGRRNLRFVKLKEHVINYIFLNFLSPKHTFCNLFCVLDMLKERPKGIKGMHFHDPARVGI